MLKTCIINPNTNQNKKGNKESHHLFIDIHNYLGGMFPL
jgi:beta-galactosidase beta subunit